MVEVVECRGWCARKRDGMGGMGRNRTGSRAGRAKSRGQIFPLGTATIDLEIQMNAVCTRRNQ